VSKRRKEKEKEAETQERAFRGKKARLSSVGPGKSN
jgi:hypothetical protein